MPRRDRAAAPGKKSKRKADGKLTKEQRIQALVEMMAGGQYVDGVTPVKMASEWGFSVETLNKDAAEASRVIRRAAEDPDLGSRIVLILIDSIAEARRLKQLRTAIEGCKALIGITLEFRKQAAIDGESAPSRDERDELVAMLQGLVARDTPGEAKGQAPGADSAAGEDPSVGVAGLGET